MYMENLGQLGFFSKGFPRHGKIEDERPANRAFPLPKKMEYYLTIIGGNIVTMPRKNFMENSCYHNFSWAKRSDPEVLNTV